MSFPRPLALTLVLPALVFGAEKAARAPEAVSAPVASTSSGYELRGFFGAGENIEVSVRRVGTEKSEWLRVGQKSGDLLIEKADPKAGTAVLLAAGRRMTLKLAAPSNAPTVSKELSPEEATAKEAKRQKLRDRFKAWQANFTPEQEETFSKVMLGRLGYVQKEFPGPSSGDNSVGEDDSMRKIQELLIPVIKEAAEAAAKLPGKDGKITPLDSEYESMVRVELEDGSKVFKPRPSPSPAGNPAVKQ